MPKIIAIQRGGLIAGIVDPVESLLSRIRGQHLPRRLKQRTDQTASPTVHLEWHRRQTVNAASTQQGKQQGLGLVVAVVSGQQEIPRSEQAGERPIARRAGHGLNALAGERCEMQVPNGQGDPKDIALRLAVGGPGA